MEQTTFEKLGIEYEERDGLLYPQITTPEDLPLGSVGKYGLLWISYMKENHYDRYRHCLRLGRLTAEACAVNEEAYRMLERIMERYLAERQPEDKSSTMGMWRLREQAKITVEEIVMADVVYHYR